MLLFYEVKGDKSREKMKYHCIGTALFMALIYSQFAPFPNLELGILCRGSRDRIYILPANLPNYI